MLVAQDLFIHVLTRNIANTYAKLLLIADDNVFGSFAEIELQAYTHITPAIKDNDKSLL